MKRIGSVVVKILRNVFCCAAILFAIVCALYEIVGDATFERILATIGISNGLNIIWIGGSIMFVVRVVISLVEKKRFRAGEKNSRYKQGEEENDETPL